MNKAVSVALTLIACILGCLYFYNSLQLQHVSSESGHIDFGPVPSWSVLVVIPGHGMPDRWLTLSTSLDILKRSVENTSITFHCVIYSYNTTYTWELKRHHICDVVESHGLWTHHMMKVNATGFTHVAILMDDVDVARVRLARAIATMDHFGLDVASAAMPLWHYAHMHPWPHCDVHFVNFVDVLFTIFTSDAWNCWQSHIDTTINPIGWGYDLTLKHLCSVTIGVLDHEVGRHGHIDTIETAASGRHTRSYSTQNATDQLYAWFGKVYDIPHRKRQKRKVKRIQQKPLPDESSGISNCGVKFYH